MISDYRDKFNQAFSKEKYQAVLDSIAADFGHYPTFRVAETPFFVNKKLKEQLLQASEEIVSFISKPDFKELTQPALDLTMDVEGEGDHTKFLAIDFGICKSEDGSPIPKLIEVQGFPTIFNFQKNLFEKFKAVYPMLEDFTPYLNRHDAESYTEMLRKVVLNGYQPHEVILLEIDPKNQNTRIDFDYAQRDLGIEAICVTEVIKEGNKLFYLNRDGLKTRIKRVYNRVIFDELHARTDLEMNFNFTDSLEVEWAGHPNWYNRISKFILPYLQGPYFIESRLLSTISTIPDDLENYVLKPLFSFSGSGVIFHVTPEHLRSVKHPDQYMLQRKVEYLPILQSPTGGVKAEIRIFAIWPESDLKPTIIGNLVRLSRGEMIGVKFNKDKDWVGGSIGVFEK
ncbi:hypothetical protein [Algoriphagus sediminis]|uniref:Circularly permuted type 2 ATP-grasp protein n=1 Tax=Algoriphagus sediminis TaxID=3057113 RepID=A0ABT7Y7W0_9BACT|nr:hypothetical protein [Algoriphagus sediminis]MDN3202530.1 hypothetical protein [Algoriphagus sediminis]